MAKNVPSKKAKAAKRKAASKKVNAVVKRSAEVIRCNVAVAECNEAILRLREVCERELPHTVGSFASAQSVDNGQVSLKLIDPSQLTLF